MASVQSKTSIKIDELVNGTVISGSVNSAGDLLLTTRGGAVINAGSVRKPFGVTWDSGTSYVVGDVVGYAGALWKAKNDNSGKPPALFTSLWTPLTGFDLTSWAQKDSLFDGDSVNESWELFWQIGSPVVSLTKTAGEFESGYQALRIDLVASSLQRFYQRVENITRGNEIVVASVRAKLASGSVGASIDASMLQNDSGGPPTPYGAGLVQTGSVEGVRALTTSWDTYTFTFVSALAKPRAIINFLASTAAGQTAGVLIDRVQIRRSSNLDGTLSAYPVGSIYMSVDSVNPGKKFGGTWVAWGSGRVPVGVDTGQTEFDTVEETGGEKTHILSVNEMPSHTHNLNGHTWYWGAGGGNVHINVDAVGGAAASNNLYTWQGTAGWNSALGTGGGAAHNNLQPYITCYMWKRTA